MTIAAKDKDFADKAGIPQKVAKEFHEEDKKLENSSKKKDSKKVK